MDITYLPMACGFVYLAAVIDWYGTAAVLAWRLSISMETTFKYEEVYLRAYDAVSHARQSLGRHLDFYNATRPHSALDRQTPNEAYFPSLTLPKAA